MKRIQRRDRDRRRALVLEALSLSRDGKSAREIADHYDISIGRARSWVNSGRVIEFEEAVRSLHAEGKTIDDIVERLGMPTARIKSALRQASWDANQTSRDA